MNWVKVRLVVAFILVFCIMSCEGKRVAEPEAVLPCVSDKYKEDTTCPRPALPTHCTASLPACTAGKSAAEAALHDMACPAQAPGLPNVPPRPDSYILERQSVSSPARRYQLGTQYQLSYIP